MQFNAFGSTPRGFQQITDLSVAVGLTPPAGGASVALLNVVGQNVRWRDDGVAPTAAVGMLLVVGDEFTYQGDLTKLKLIEVVSGAELNVSYYSATGGILKP